MRESHAATVEAIASEQGSQVSGDSLFDEPLGVIALRELSHGPGHLSVLGVWPVPQTRLLEGPDERVHGHVALELSNERRESLTHHRQIVSVMEAGALRREPSSGSKNSGPSVARGIARVMVASNSRNWRIRVLLFAGKPNYPLRPTRHPVAPLKSEDPHTRGRPGTLSDPHNRDRGSRHASQAADALRPQAPGRTDPAARRAACASPHLLISGQAGLRQMLLSRPRRSLLLVHDAHRGHLSSKVPTKPGAVDH